jgi:hypothetical protein
MHIAFDGRNWQRRSLIVGIVFGLSVPMPFTLAGTKKDSASYSKSEGSQATATDIVSRGRAAIVPAGLTSADNLGGEWLLVLRVQPEAVAADSPVILEVYLRDPSGAADRYIGSYGFFPPPRVGEVREIYLPLQDRDAMANLLAGAPPPEIVVRLCEINSLHLRIPCGFACWTRGSLDSSSSGEMRGGMWMNPSNA